MDNGNGLSASDVALVSGANNGVRAADLLALGGYGGMGMNNGFGGGEAIWLLALLALMGGFGGNGWGGNGFNNGLMWGNNLATQDSVQNGFNQAATQNMLTGLQSSVNSGFGDTALGIAGINQNICQSSAGITAAITNGFAQNEIADNARQIANMQQSFNSQTAITGGLNNLQSQLANCCCENRLATQGLQSTIIQENCADREALNYGIRDIIANQTAGFQSIKDMMCQDKIDAKNEKIAELQNQVNMQNLIASQTAQTAQLVADNTAQTQYIVNRVAPYPVPSYNVPNPFGCGCNNNNWYGGWNNGYGFNPFGNVGYGNGSF